MSNYETRTVEFAHFEIREGEDGRCERAGARARAADRNVGALEVNLDRAAQRA